MVELIYFGYKDRNIQSLFIFDILIFQRFQIQCLLRCCVHALVNLKLELLNAVEAAKLAAKDDGAAAVKGSTLEDT